MTFLARAAQLDFFGWLYTLAKAAIAGAASTILAAAGTTVTGALPFTFRQMETMAISGAIIAIATILAKSPLPELIGGEK